jgi:hypothetical protein
MRLTSGHLLINEKVWAGKLAVCLRFWAAKRPHSAFRAHAGHKPAPYLWPLSASVGLAASPQRRQGRGIMFASRGHGPSLNARPGRSLSPQQRHDRIARCLGVKTFPSVIGGCPLPAHAKAHVTEEAGSAHAPRRKFQTSLTTLTGSR